MSAHIAVVSFWLPFLYVVVLAAYPAADSTHDVQCCGGHGSPVTVNGTLLCQRDYWTQTVHYAPEHWSVLLWVRGVVMVCAFLLHFGLTLQLLGMDDEFSSFIIGAGFALPAVLLALCVGLWNNCVPRSPLGIVASENAALFVVMVLQYAASCILTCVYFFSAPVN